jgi:hypothetical protein
MVTLFGKTKKLEGDVDDFLFVLQKTSLIFYEAIQEYINGDFESYYKCVVDVRELEEKADRLKRKIKNKLYKNMLIPDVRGDVWDMVESLDKLLDVAKKVLENISFEKPIFPVFMSRHFLNIADNSRKAVDELANATNAYLTHFTMVQKYIDRVKFYEHEIDKIEDMAKKAIFSSNELKTLSHRIQLRYFIEKMALLSDIAESVCEKLSVFVIKREV